MGRPVLREVVDDIGENAVADTSRPVLAPADEKLMRRAEATHQLDNVTEKLANSQNNLFTSTDYNAIRLHQGLSQLRQVLGQYKGSTDDYVASTRRQLSLEAAPHNTAKIVIACAGWEMLADMVTTEIDQASPIGTSIFVRQYPSPSWIGVKVGEEGILQASAKAALGAAQQLDKLDGLTVRHIAAVSLFRDTALALYAGDIRSGRGRVATEMSGLADDYFVKAWQVMIHHPIPPAS